MPTDPKPVTVENKEPLPVTLAGPLPVDGEVKAPSVTTFEQDRTTAEQREISRIWETTQMKIALSVIWASLVVSGAIAVFGKYLGSTDMQLAAVVFLFGVANLVTGFYFGRTNHTKVGGQGDTGGKER